MNLVDFKSFWKCDPIIADPEDKRDLKLYLLKQISNAANGLRSETTIALASVFSESQWGKSFPETDLGSYIQEHKLDNSSEAVQWDYLETELKTLLSRYQQWLEWSQTIHSIAIIHPLNKAEQDLEIDTPDQRLSAIKQALDTLYTTT